MSNTSTRLICNNFVSISFKESNMLSTDDVEVLYRARADYLQRLVRLDTAAADDVIEDACQHAWTAVLAHRRRVDDHRAFAWLAITAMREAWRLTRRCGSWEPFEGEAPPLLSPVEVVELRDRLHQLRRLPSRQQRLIWLHAAGLSYDEMARHEGVTRRTVERQLLRGTRAARVMDGDVVEGGA
jgi:RNA polymerase sigma factor (sigma-70 family)